MYASLAKTEALGRYDTRWSNCANMNSGNLLCFNAEDVCCLSYSEGS